MERYEYGAKTGIPVWWDFTPENKDGELIPCDLAPQTERLKEAFTKDDYSKSTETLQAED